VVLTADRTLMARYDVLLDGMTAASQTTTVPMWAMGGFMMPRAAHPGGRCEVAPLGLRRVEASLLRAGMPVADIALVDDLHLHEVVGPDTKVIAVSSGEPMGLGMSSSTMATIAGGSIWPHVLFDDLMGRIAKLRKLAPGAKLLVGGPGAWQLAADEAGTGARGIDHAVVGYAEGNVAQVVQGLLEGTQLPRVITGVGVPVDQIPAMFGASTMGVVELSRGCGLGCEFCTLAKVPMGDLPAETILSDLETNLRTGRSAIAALSEDFFRYGGQGVNCRPAAAIDILTQMREVRGLGPIQLDHCNVSSIAQYSDDELAEVERLLRGGGGGRPWVNIGIETAAGALLRANGGGAKMAGVRDEDWGAYCAQQLRRLCGAGFTPMASLVVGMPHETEADVERTRQWVRELGGETVTVFPVLYAPIHDREEQARPLRKCHWRLWQECYERNFRWVPVMYGGDQLAAGVGGARRFALQAMGKGQVLLWRFLLSRGYRRAPA
jgi:radical SAM superfamily enzyme YgiQ (UPF0313 family)